MLGCGASPACRHRPGLGRAAIPPIRATAAAASRCWSRSADAAILIDTSPDLREQLIDAGSRGSTP